MGAKTYIIFNGIYNYIYNIFFFLKWDSKKLHHAATGGLQNGERDVKRGSRLLDLPIPPMKVIITSPQTRTEVVSEFEVKVHICFLNGFRMVFWYICSKLTLGEWTQTNIQILKISIHSINDLLRRFNIYVVQSECNAFFFCISSFLMTFSSSIKTNFSNQKFITYTNL